MAHISPSQVNMYTRCSAQYGFRYIEGIKKPPTIALTLGRSLDEAVNVNYVQKIESWEDVAEDVVCDAFTTTFDKEIKETELRADEKRDDYREQGIGLVKTYHRDIAPSVQPLSVQEPIQVVVDGIPFSGIVDLTDLNGIRDTKSTSKTPPTKDGVLMPSDGEHTMQMQLYSMAVEARDGKAPANMYLDYVVKNKTPKAVSVEVKIGDRDRKFALSMAKRVVEGVEKGVFIPNRASFKCSRKVCGFWRECEATYGGTVKE